MKISVANVVRRFIASRPLIDVIINSTGEVFTIPIRAYEALVSSGRVRPVNRGPIRDGVNTGASDSSSTRFVHPGPEEVLGPLQRTGVPNLVNPGDRSKYDRLRSLRFRGNPQAEALHRKWMESVEEREVAIRAAQLELVQQTARAYAEDYLADNPDADAGVIPDLAASVYENLVGRVTYMSKADIIAYAADEMSGVF